jgi:single-strand DNA-binding protein
MLQTTVIGNVGADAQVNNKDGREFVTFRVAHNDSWTDANGQQHSSVIWVDCIMNGHPKVTEFIKAGTQVVGIGRTSLRVYSSQKDRCMKAGLTINVESIQLLGGVTDEVPRRLYDQNGVQHDVTKFYLTDVKSSTLMNTRGDQFVTDEKGWVTPVKPTADAAAPETSQDQQERNADGSPVQVF